MNREEEIFAAANALPPEQRGGFLDRACAGDRVLRARMAELLAGYEQAQRAFTAPFVDRARPMPEETTGDRIGRYKLLQRIGEGGCGMVWMAEQDEPVRRRVALKVIKLGMDTKAVVARFEAERQALAMMDHPNIAKVYDAGATDAGRPFFVMELVRGISITNYCDENHLTPAERLGLFVQVCHAVQHAHQKGIIHRDLKPSNILVTLNDGAAMPKIIDFGVAKATQGRLTESTLFTAFEQFIGTPVYMSPEQAEISSLDIDTRADIYSLGILLYELLTGRPPFDPKAFAQAGIDAIRHHIREDEPPRPSTRWRTLAEAERTTIARLRRTAPSQLSVMLRGDLDWVVMHCIEKDRTRRYETASGLAADIERYLRHEPVIARPPSTVYLVQKLIRRHRVGFSAAAAIAAVVVIGAGAAAWQAWRATQAKAEAQAAQRNEARLRVRAEAQELVARQRAYAADMREAQDALANHHPHRARELLAQNRPEPGQRDLRDWEWRYLWLRTRETEVEDVFEVLLGDVRGRIWSLASSSDGRWLAIGRHFLPTNERRGVVTVVDLELRQKFEFEVGADHNLVEFVPNSTVLAISGHVPGKPRQSGVELWDVTNRQLQQRLVLGEPCVGLAFSAEGDVLVTASTGESAEGAIRWTTITRWSIPGGDELSHCRAPETGRIHFAYRFAISADLRFAAYPAKTSGEFEVIDLSTGLPRWRGKLPARPSSSRHEVTALAFSPDAKLLVAACMGTRSAFELWDVASGAHLGGFEGHGSWVASVAFSPDGETLASASEDKTIRFWDVPSRRLLRTRGIGYLMRELEWVPQREQLVYNTGPDIRVWRTHLTSRSEVAATAPGPTPRAATILYRNLAWRFAHDSRSVLTAELPGTISEWSVPGFQLKRSLTVELPATIRERMEDDPRSATAAFAPDQPLVAFGSGGDTIVVFDFEQQSQVAEIKLAGAALKPVAFFGGGGRLVTCDAVARPAAYQEWDLRRQILVARWPAAAGHVPRATTFVRPPDEKHALMLNPDRTAVLHDLTAGTSREIPLPIQGAFAAAFSADGQRLAVVNRLGEAKVWLFPSFQEVATLSGAIHGMTSVAFSPQGTRLATTSSLNEAAIIWDIESRRPVLSLAGRGGMFLGPTRFSPDGATLGTLTGAGGALYLWRAPSWEEIAAMEKAPATAAANLSR